MGMGLMHDDDGRRSKIYHSTHQYFTELRMLLLRTDSPNNSMIMRNSSTNTTTTTKRGSRGGRIPHRQPPPPPFGWLRTRTIERRKAAAASQQALMLCVGFVSFVWLSSSSCLQLHMLVPCAFSFSLVSLSSSSTSSRSAFYNNKETILSLSSSYKGYPEEFDRQFSGRKNNNKNNGDDDDEGEDSNPFDLWWQGTKKSSSSSSSSSSPYVRPIGVDGHPLQQKSQPPTRIQSGLDKLFGGMPSVNEILGGSSSSSSTTAQGDEDDNDGAAEEDEEENDNIFNRPRRSRRRSPKSGDGTSINTDEDDDNTDYAWFDEERDRIRDNYRDILKDMLEQVERNRRDNPESVPDNAKAMVQSIWKEELDREIRETREIRARERVDDYERFVNNKRLISEQHDDEEVLSSDNPTVQKLYDDSEQEFVRREKSQAQLDDFLRYEEEAFARAAEQVRAQSIPEPKPGADLDAWALERLEAMAADQQDEGGEDSDDGDLVLEILEENVMELKKGIEKQQQSATSSTIQPETPKEWQMYRAIANRGDNSSSNSNNRQNMDPADEQQRIRSQLESWKDYVKKETSARAQSGLAREGPKMPFEWQESSLAWDQKATVPDTRSRAQVRKDINRMSIEAMESLVETTNDPLRRENLKREIEYLKSTLESRDYLDVEEEEDEIMPVAPVDLSGVFTRSGAQDDDGFYDDRYEEERDPFSPQSQQQQQKRQQQATQDASVIGSTTSPPDSPFFAEQQTQQQDLKSSPPPPNTPFFSADDEASAATTGDSKLGSMKEQKLNAMFRRAGVRSKDEQDVIRRQWEDFQRTEQAKRMESGLSSFSDGGGDDDATAADSLKYNISDVMREDGDFDAEKVLASIGPRPKRSKKQIGSSNSSSREDPSMRSSVDDNDIRESLYRAVSAVGGGRYKEDPEARAREQAAFEEFFQKEEEMRQSLDEFGDSVKGAVEVDPTLDDKEYAEEVLSSLGPRPQPKRTRIVNEGEFSDKGGVLASEDEDDETVQDADVGDSLMSSMPDWLRKEREQDQQQRGRSKGRFPGSDIDEVFDDDYYDHNMRQLHEYEQRRAGRQRRQIGIDISDVVGRRAYETDDYADYKFDDDRFRGRESGWGAASFEARKRDLLQYTELDLAELNLLMDYKDSVYSTGVSQYLPRINKPFKEFGAIFRLEGLLVDVTGLQFRAWKKVAEKFGFRAPTVEDVHRASVIRSEIAVREAFFWTDDIIECRDAAMAHKEALRKEFDAWRDSVGISAPVPTPAPAPSGFLAIGNDIIEDTPQQLSQTRVVGSSSAAWALIAECYGKTAPTAEDSWHAASLSVEEAILAFRWTDDPAVVLEIAQAYRDYMQSGILPSKKKMGPRSEQVAPLPAPPIQQPVAPGPVPVARVVLDENAVLETHYYAWTKVAERFRFEAPDPEAVLAAFTINDPEIAVRGGFGWTDNADELAEVVRFFKTTLEELLRERSGGKIPVLDPQPTTTKQTKADASKSKGPTADELLAVQVGAWSAAARAYGLPIPSSDMVKLTQGVDPEDAVQRLLRWTDDSVSISDIAAAYKRSLDELMRPLMRQYGLKFEAAAGGPKSVVPSTSLQSGPTGDDIFLLSKDSWTAVAKKNNLPVPENDQVMFALTVGPEEAIVTGFQWTEDRETAKKLLESYTSEVGIRRQTWTSRGLSSSQSASSSKSKQSEDDSIPPVTVAPDVAKWVQSLLDVEMQCVVVSFLEQEQLDVLLEYAGLSDLFTRDRRVSASDGYSRDSQQLLGAALRLERRPDHCVAFDSSPQASEAAHENKMQSVNIIGPYPRYELLAADATAGSFNELTAMNIRRLFGERIYDQPQLETAATQPVVKRQPKIQTQYWDDD